MSKSNTFHLLDKRHMFTCFRHGVCLLRSITALVLSRDKNDALVLVCSMLTVIRACRSIPQNGTLSVVYNHGCGARHKQIRSRQCKQAYGSMPDTLQSAIGACCMALARGWLIVS